jgi:hypothetical protein
MEIKYLKKMQQHPKLRSWKNEGMSLAEIEKLEQEYNQGRPFPTAYREFLFLGGEHSNLGDIDTGVSYEWMQQLAREEVAASGKTIDRPYWVTDQLDRCTQFGFIYLDEDTEDPVIYYCYADKSYHKEFGFIVPRPQGTFSNYINVCVERAVLEDSFRRK